MNYTYEFTRIDPKQLFVQVLYKAEGRDPVLRNFNPTDYSEENLKRVAENGAIRVLEQWKLRDEAPDEVAIVTGKEFSASYVEPKAKITVEQPSYDSLLQYLEESEVEKDDGIYQEWTVVDYNDDTKKANLIAHAKEVRKSFEMRGTSWTDSEGEILLVDTNPLSQARYTSAVTAISSGLRSNNGIWKFHKMAGVGEPVTEVTLEDGTVESHPDGIYLEQVMQDVFRPTTNAELIEISGVVLGYIQLCFDAEAAVVSKIKDGQLDINCTEEFQIFLFDLESEPTPE